MEIIKIEQSSIGGNNIDTVNARTLHEFMEVSTEFRHWIKRRIEDFGFIENQDFTTTVKNDRGQAIEYHITFDMAKELSMVERNEKGKQARQYFIECEKRAKNLSPELQIANAILLAGKMIEEQRVQIEEMKPKAEFYDTVTESDTTIDMASAAKVLNCGVGRTKLFQFLRDEKILSQTNEPYQNFISAGYFRVTEKPWHTPNGTAKVSLKTVVTQKGLDFIRKRLAARKGDK